MSLSALLRLDFDRSERSLAETRRELIARREAAVRHHRSVAEIDAELRRITHLLLRKRRRRVRGAL